METAIRISEQFGRRIAAADYVGAHALLTKGAQQAYTPKGFQRSFAEMTDYEPGAIKIVEIDAQFVLEDWQAKRPEDVACVYVVLLGEEYVEAVTLTLAREDGDIRIREIEWGQP